MMNHMIMWGNLFIIFLSLYEKGIKRNTSRKACSEFSVLSRDENIRYICRYISNISDIGDVQYDIGDISLIYRFWIDILSKYQVYDTRAS